MTLTGLTALTAAPTTPRGEQLREGYAPAALEVRAWQRAYARRLRLTDTVLVVAAVAGAYLGRYGPAAVGLTIPGIPAHLGYPALLVTLSAAWLVALTITGSYDPRVIGAGAAEYSRVGTATVVVFGLLALAALGCQIQPSRVVVLVSGAAGLVLLVAGRWLWRQWLSARRRRGQCVRRVALVGSRDHCRDTARQLSRATGSGYLLVGAIVDPDDDPTLVPGLPVLGDHDPVALAEAAGADTIAYTGSPHYDAQRLRALGWDIEARKMTLVMAPGLTDVAGPRISAQAVAGVPLIQVDYPSIEGWPRFAKRALDLIGAATLLVLLSPLLLALALAIRLDSPGPALFRQARVGYRGRHFQVLKFRTMAADAEARQAAFRGRHDGNEGLFKLKRDPRVTRVGAVLRRYSLDELPQLVNVVRNEMSLVGPRPLPIHEAERGDDWAERRTFVKPGITGLWQVSGRSDLSWDESVRLDLYYVENWSLAQDLTILFRTVRAVVRPRGAY